MSCFHCDPSCRINSAGLCDDCAQENALDDLEWGRLKGMTTEQVNADLIDGGMTQEQIDAFVAKTKANVAKWSKQ